MAVIVLWLCIHIRWPGIHISPGRATVWVCVCEWTSECTYRWNAVCLSHTHSPVAYHIVLTLHLRPNLLYLFDFVFSYFYFSAESEMRRSYFFYFSSESLFDSSSGRPRACSAAQIRLYRLPFGYASYVNLYSRARTNDIMRRADNDVCLRLHRGRRSRTVFAAWNIFFNSFRFWVSDEKVLLLCCDFVVNISGRVWWLGEKYNEIRSERLMRLGF